MCDAPLVQSPDRHALDTEVTMATHRFAALHAALQGQVDQGFLAGVSTALIQGGDVVDRFCCGWADREAGVPLREDHLMRVFSNTKLVTSCAVLLLCEEGRLQLDDPVARYLPALGRRMVLRPGATDLLDVEPAHTAMTVRHLMTHTSGLSYGMFDPGSLLFRAYQAAQVLSPRHDLAGLLEALGPLPLAFHPGTQWAYSVATDVLGRLVEVVTGERFGDFLRRRLFDPLGMVDTGFSVPAAQQGRLSALYGGVDLLDPFKPGLVRMDDKPYPQAYLRPPMRESGGGGLVSTLNDMVRLVQALLPGNSSLLRPDTLHQMGRNQLAPGLHVLFPNMPSNPGRVFGLGSSVLAVPGRFDPPSSAGEISWGGLAGTTWWIHPQHRIAGVLMTQRYFGFGNPYTFMFRKLAYEALVH